MITNISYPINFARYQSRQNVSFKSNPAQTLTHTNIGSCLEGYIGKVQVRKGNGFKLLNVFKKFKNGTFENYSIKNDRDELIGNMEICIQKYPTNPWDKAISNYVFVNELRNFSNPISPYYKNGLEYYKDIGTRLLQIAQRRSDEALCEGNIKLISKNESLEWYKNIIGMRPEFPKIQGQISYHNPNLLYLPPESKEPLSKLQGGL